MVFQRHRRRIFKPGQYVKMSFLPCDSLDEVQSHARRLEGAGIVAMTTWYRKDWFQKGLQDRSSSGRTCSRILKAEQGQIVSKPILSRKSGQIPHQIFEQRLQLQSAILLKERDQPI
jgi:hypothetical protein